MRGIRWVSLKLEIALPPMTRKLLLPVLLIFFPFESVLFAGSATTSHLQYGFIENKGQIINQDRMDNQNVRYLYNGSGLNVQLLQNGFSYEMMKALPEQGSNSFGPPSDSKFTEPAKATCFVHRIDFIFENANQNIEIIPSEPYSDYLNYYSERSGEFGYTFIRHFSKVSYKNVYPGIDVEFLLNDRAQKNGLKYNFIVHPGGDVNAIRIEINGAIQTSVNEEKMLIETAYGTIEETFPESYLVDAQNRKEDIIASYSDLGNGFYGIEASKTSPDRTLVIDPVPWATYYGGSGSDQGNGITTDSVGNVYVVGTTTSSTNIASSGAFQTSYTSNTDAFVVKFNNAGTRQWGTYYGGSGTDNGNSITINRAGKILFCGETSSTSGIATTGVHQISIGGAMDAFVVQFSPNGTRDWGTYYGGVDSDFGKSIATDKNNQFMIGGYTDGQSNGIASSTAQQPNYGGGYYDAFVARFNSSGVLMWGSYYGGTGEDFGTQVSSDSSGNTFLVGYTNSSNAISSSGAHQSSLGGYNDCFIVKFSSTGTRQWGTYYGGTGEDKGYTIKNDLAGNLICGGTTESNTGIATPGSFKPYFSNVACIFITKFNSNGVRQWGTYYGDSSGGNVCADLVLDSAGTFYITGNTSASYGMATPGVAQTAFYGSGPDALVAKFNSSGYRVWMTYFGSPVSDYGYGIAIGSLGNIVITGKTVGPYSTLATSGAHQTTNGGNNDAFVASFTNYGGLPVTLTSFEVEMNSPNSVQCVWKTAQEINNDHFDVERSPDGVNFTTIAAVRGAGNSATFHSYAFQDNRPLHGHSYYRLAQIDFDGKSTLSNIVEIEYCCDGPNLFVSNDFEPSLNIRGVGTNERISLEIFSSDGTLLKTDEILTTSSDVRYSLIDQGKPGMAIVKCTISNRIYCLRYINN
jgi:uncharacterized protein (DUF2147 family)